MNGGFVRPGTVPLCRLAVVWLLCVPGAKAGTSRATFELDFRACHHCLGQFWSVDGYTLRGGISETGAVCRYGLRRRLADNRRGNCAGCCIVSQNPIDPGLYAVSVPGRSLGGLRAAKTGAGKIWSDSRSILRRVAVLKNTMHTFPEKKSIGPEALEAQTVSIWNTWGMWRFKKYPIRPIADFMETDAATR